MCIRDRHQLGDHPNEVPEMMDEELGQVGDTDLQHTAQSIDGSLVGVVDVLGVDGVDFGLEDMTKETLVVLVLNGVYILSLIHI